MPGLLGYILLFLVVGIGFIFVHLVVGKLIRPDKPSAEKLTIYECGEPTIGSAWVQFDLRFYVIALLFVIFDVEVVFFFPWAIVFGKATTLARKSLPDSDRTVLTRELLPETSGKYVYGLRAGQPLPAVTSTAARELAWLAFWDILIFFGVLLVGFAYLWKRGDLDWVRSTLAEQTATADAPPPLPPERAGELVGAGSLT